MFYFLFVNLFRTKRKVWMKNNNVDECRPPPRPPLMPRYVNVVLEMMSVK